MPKLLTSPWAKNVNKLRIAGGVTSDNLSTNRSLVHYLCYVDRVQTQLSDNYLPYKSTNLYTYLNSKINLLNKSFTHYPQPLLMSLMKEI